jgi:hypothetical protein
MKDQINLVGEVQILKNGEVVLEKKNLIVQAGKNFLASAVINSSTPFVGMAIGTGTTPASTSDTTLETEIARAAFTSSSVSTNVVSLSNTYAAGTGTGSISEAGIFTNATSGGTMLSHVVFSSIGKGALDTLTINWTITVG